MGIQRGNAPPAISIIETDINVDFKEPRDYKEWEKKNKNKTFNKKTSKMNESKLDDEEEEEELDEEFGTILDPKQATQNGKRCYFESLEQSGHSPQKLKKQKSSKTPKKIKKQESKSVPMSPANPYTLRGAPLGKKRGGALGSKAK